MPLLGRWLGAIGACLGVLACAREPPTERAPPPPPKPVGISAPASFVGELPCPECAVTHATLTLRSDGLFLLRSDSRGGTGAGDRSVTTLGTWRQRPERARLLLQSAIEPVRAWEILSPWRLRRLDHNGNPIRSQEPYELDRAPDLDAHDDLIDFSGMYDGGLVECGSGRSWPVADEREQPLLERAYAALRRAPGVAVRAALSGHFGERPRPSGGGTQEVIVVDHFQELYPDADCTTAVTPTSLEDRDWTVVELEGRTLPAKSGALRLISSEQRLRAGDGCGRLSGEYRLGPGALRFAELSVNGAGCRHDAALGRALRATRSYRFEGSRLELLDGDRVLVRLTPAPLAARRE